MRYLVFCMTLFLLTGCAVTPPAKEILADPDAYLASHFTPENLDREVREKMKLPPVGKIKNVMEIKTVMTVEDREKSVFDRKIKVKVFESGLVQKRTETGRNGFVSVSGFGLEYGYLVSLKAHELLHDTSYYNRPAYQIALPGKIDKGFLDPKENSTYSVDYEAGTPIQLAGFSKIQYSCSTGEKFDANSLNSKLSGKAIYFNCEYKNTNGAVSSRSKYLALLDYGVGLPVEESNSSRKRHWVISDVTINN